MNFNKLSNKERQRQAKYRFEQTEKQYEKEEKKAAEDFERMMREKLEFNARQESKTDKEREFERLMEFLQEGAK